MATPPKKTVEINLDDVDFTGHVAAHPSDAVQVAGFRVGTLHELRRMSDELQHMSDELGELTKLIDKYRTPLYRLTQRDVFIVEVFLSLASFWAAYTFWHVPTLFQAFPQAFRLIQAVEGNTGAWGMFAFIAASLKLIGVGSCLDHNPMWGRIARYAGLAMSGVFWTVMGGGVMLGNPNTLFGFNSLLMGALSWWSLLRLIR